MLDLERKWAISCYIPVFNVVMCVLTAIRMYKSEFCSFHSRQGLVLFALWFATIVVALFSQILSLMMWGVVLVLHGAGVYLVINNLQVKIPVVGQLAMKIPRYHIYTLLTGKSPDILESDPTKSINNSNNKTNHDSIN